MSDSQNHKTVEKKPTDDGDQPASEQKLVNNAI